MTIEGWKQVIRKASHDEHAFNLLAQLLVEQDEATYNFRERGYGVTGQSLLNMSQEAPSLYANT